MERTRCPLLDAVRSIGLFPLGRNVSPGKNNGNHYFRSRARWMFSSGRLDFGRENLYWEHQPKRCAVLHRSYLWLDHHEDWSEVPRPGRTDLGQGPTSLITWHQHGYLDAHGRLTDRGAPTDPYQLGPVNFPWCWAGPSWYAPGAITGLTWEPHLTERVLAALGALRLSEVFEPTFSERFFPHDPIFAGHRSR